MDVSKAKMGDILVSTNGTYGCKYNLARVTNDTGKAQLTAVILGVYTGDEISHVIKVVKASGRQVGDDRTWWQLADKPLGDYLRENQRVRESAQQKRAEQERERQALMEKTHAVIGPAYWQREWMGGPGKNALSSLTFKDSRDLPVTFVWKAEPEKKWESFDAAEREVEGVLLHVAIFAAPGRAMGFGWVNHNANTWALTELEALEKLAMPFLEEVK